MLQHNHNADYVPNKAKHLFPPSRVWSCCHEVEFWQKSVSLVISMQIATSLKRPSTHYLGVGAGVSRREEVKGKWWKNLFSFFIVFSCFPMNVLCVSANGWGNQTAHSAVAVFMRNCADMRKLFWCPVTVSVRRTKSAKQDDWESRRPFSILRTRRHRQWALPGHIKPVLLKSHQIQHHAKTLEGLFDISRDPLGSDESIPGGGEPSCLGQEVCVNPWSWEGNTTN